MGQTILEINGVKYDAVTGAVLQGHPRSTPTIDGIIPHSSHKAPVAAQKPVIEPARNPHFKPTLSRKIQDVTVVQGRHAHKSHTLMRSIVKKPGQPLKQAQVAAETMVVPSSSYHATSQHQARLVRAQNTQPADIHRFAPLAPNKLEPKLDHLPVANMPAPAIAPPIDQPHHKISPRQTSSDFVAAQLASQPNTEQPSPFKKKPLKARVATRLKKPKLTSIAAASLSVLIIGGFIVYQNLASLSLIAANRTAGIGAHLPKGVPSNFAVSHNIDSSKGQITLTFSSRTDDRRFTLTQQTSDMSNSELQQALEASNTKNVQSYESNGIKLYITGPGQADWIDGNMRYNISGTSGLSSDQLAMIARSL